MCYKLDKLLADIQVYYENRSKTANNIFQEIKKECSCYSEVLDELSLLKSEYMYSYKSKFDCEELFNDVEKLIFNEMRSLLVNK